MQLYQTLFQCHTNSGVLITLVANYPNDQLPKVQNSGLTKRTKTTTYELHIVRDCFYQTLFQINNLCRFIKKFNHKCAISADFTPMANFIL